MKKLSVVGVVLLGIVSAGVAVMYFTQGAGSLPHFLPGYRGAQTTIILSTALLSRAWQSLSCWAPGWPAASQPKLLNR